MKNLTLYRHQTYSEKSLANLSQIVGSSEVELHFDHIRVIANGKEESKSSYFGYGQLRFSAPSMIQKKPQVLVVNILVPKFHILTTAKENSQEVMISLDHYPANYLAEHSFALVGSTIIPEIASALKQICLVHTKAIYSEPDAQLADLMESSLLILGELPEDFTGTQESYDVLSFIALKYENGQHVIIEILDSPNSYQVHCNDEDKWQYLKESIDEDTGAPQFIFKHLLS